MSSLQSQIMRPCLLIDLKKGRIRIHKSTLHLLGDPEYVQFLINPDDQALVVRKSSRRDFLSQHVRWRVIGGKQCCDFYSRFLLRALQDVHFDWKENRSYRIYGQLHTKESLALFSMKDSYDIDCLADPGKADYE